MSNIERSGHPFGVPDAGDFHCGRCGTLLDGGTDEPVAARELRQQLAGAVNLDDEAVIERATRALCDEEWWEDDWMTAMNVVGIVFQAAKGGQ